MPSLFSRTPTEVSPPESPLAVQKAYYDISHERDYDPPLKDTSWYLFQTGLISRDKKRLFQEMEEQFKEPVPGYDPSDYPIFAAPTFKSIVGLLPRCPSLMRHFKRLPSGEMKQTREIYFVLHGLNCVFPSPAHALRMLELYNAPLAVIVAVSDHDEAVKLAADYPAMNARGLQHLESVKKRDMLAAVAAVTT